MTSPTPDAFRDAYQALATEFATTNGTIFQRAAASANLRRDLETRIRSLQDELEYVTRQYQHYAEQSCAVLDFLDQKICYESAYIKAARYGRYPDAALAEFAQRWMEIVNFRAIRKASGSAHMSVTEAETMVQALVDLIKTDTTQEDPDA